MCIRDSGYIVGIAFLPDIRRVFCYHGAEHKTIHAYESGDTVTPESAIRFSRLHPRCGTTFLLFVMSIAILLHTVLVPLLLLVWTPDSAVAKHLFTIAFKLLLMVPISALSYDCLLYTFTSASRTNARFPARKPPSRRSR